MRQASLVNLVLFTVLFAVAAIVVMVVLLFCLYVWIAKDPAQSLIFVNNAGIDIEISSTKQTANAAVGESVTIQCQDAFEIRANANEKWMYRYVGVGSQNVVGGGRAYLQVEPDGRIYVLGAARSKPVAQLPNQPPGYPLVPRRDISPPREEKGGKAKAEEE
jgi:hypothetical protein